MKKVIDILLIILIFFIIYFLQINFFSWFNIAGIKPNLFVILMMLIGLFMKKYYGFGFGVLFGILLDFFVGTKIGINAIALGIVGLVSSYLDKNFSKDNRMTVIFMTIGLTLISAITEYILKILFCNEALQILGFVRIVSIEVIFNIILIIILYPIFYWFGNKIENDFTSNKSFLNFF